MRRHAVLFQKHGAAAPYTEVFHRLCYRKRLMLFSLSSKGVTDKMPYPRLPPRGKPEKKAVFSPYCGDETTINLTEPFHKRKTPVRGCFGRRSARGGFSVRGSPHRSVSGPPFRTAEGSAIAALPPVAYTGAAPHAEFFCSLRGCPPKRHPIPKRTADEVRHIPL